jgi:hypothetical protein
MRGGVCRGASQRGIELETDVINLMEERLIKSFWRKQQ